MQVPSWDWRRDVLLSYLSSHTVNKCSFHGLSSVILFSFFCFSLVISLFIMAPKHSAEMLSTTPKCNKAVICLMEKTYVLDKLCSGMSYSAVDHEFTVKESTMHIQSVILKQKHMENVDLYWLFDEMLWSEFHKNLTLYFS